MLHSLFSLVSNITCWFISGSSFHFREIRTEFYPNPYCLGLLLVKVASKGVGGWWQKRNYATFCPSLCLSVCLTYRGILLDQLWISQLVKTRSRDKNCIRMTGPCVEKTKHTEMILLKTFSIHIQFFIQNI